MFYDDNCYENNHGSSCGFYSGVLFDPATAYDSFSGSMSDELFENISIRFHDSVSHAFSSYDFYGIA